MRTLQIDNFADEDAFGFVIPDSATMRTRITIESDAVVTTTEATIYRNTGEHVATVTAIHDITGTAKLEWTDTNPQFELWDNYWLEDSVPYRYTMTLKTTDEDGYTEEWNVKIKKMLLKEPISKQNPHAQIYAGSWKLTRTEELITVVSY